MVESSSKGIPSDCVGATRTPNAVPTWPMGIVLCVEVGVSFECCYPVASQNHLIFSVRMTSI